METDAALIQPAPNLYPDVIAAGGSLAEALRQAGRKMGIDLDDVRGPKSPTDSWRLIVAVAADKRGDVILTLGQATRAIGIRVWLNGVGDAVKFTIDDLETAVTFISDWRSGARLEDLSSRWPQADVAPKALAHERGDVVAFQWHHIRDLAPRLVDHDIVEAAYAHPVLRALFPMVSHGSLQFSRCTRYPFSNDVPGLFPLGNGRWRVHYWSEDVPPRDTESATEAINVVVAGLPDGFGPAIEGDREQLLSMREGASSAN